MAEPSTRPTLALASAFLLTGTLGSIHGFGVFLAPLEQALQASREAVSLIYSIALLSLTGAVLGSHLMFRRFAPARLIVLVGAGAAAGLLLPVWSDGLGAYYLGYGLLFGAANGLGYALALQLAARARPDAKGFWMGAVTAVYALGATAAAFVFAWAVAGAGVSFALTGLAIVMGLVGVLGAALVAKSAVTLETEASGGDARGERRASGLIVLMWIGYASGCLAGLMAIGHSAGIVLAAGGSDVAAARGVSLIAAANAIGGFAAGYLADRVPVRWLLAGLSLGSALGLGWLSLTTGTAAALAGLALVGLTYGAIIALYPVATATYFGMAQMARVYGLIFTAWGVAGLAGPWLAGKLFDQTASYGAATAIAAGAALVSVAVSYLLPKQDQIDAE